jgi:hypothetical protein
MPQELLAIPPRYASPPLAAPGGRGYIHVAAEVDAPVRAGPVFSRSGAHRALVEELKQLAAALAQVTGVTGAAVFDAVLMPPPGYYRGDWGRSARPPRFDVVVFVETLSPEVARAVQRSPAFRAVIDALAPRARRLHTMVARAAKRLADVERRPRGLYVFRYLVGEVPETAVRIWDPLIGWYVAETQLENGELLVPLEDQASDYAAIDHARFDMGLFRFVWRHVMRESYWRWIRPFLEENHVEATPVVYRLA